ncbi:MAG: AsnC family transcriptional regulator [Thermoproteota archaeon]|nr:AsnC family transcriptional regulator [Thermoproteota archaeon]
MSSKMIEKEYDFHMDHLDIEILKILADNCRTSYRSIGLTLGLTTNTVKRRVNILIQNKIVEKFITNLNFAVLGYSMNCLLIIRHQNSDLDEIAKYLHRFGNIYLRINAIGGTSVFGIIVKPTMEQQIMLLKETSRYDLLKVVENNSTASISIRDIFVGYHTSHFKLIETDLKIIKCLLFDPRMTIVDIANTISASRRTVIRRMEAMTEKRLLNFGLVYNPSAMKGYNYFSILAQADKGFFQDIIKRIYADLSRNLLRHPMLIHKDVIILNLYSENVFDIERIFRKVESFPGVKKAEVFQPLEIKWLQDWMVSEIDSRMRK